MKKGLFVVFFLFLITMPAQATQLYYSGIWQPEEVGGINQNIDIKVESSDWTTIPIVTQQAPFFDMDDDDFHDPGEKGVVAYCIEPLVSIDITDAAYSYQLLDPATYTIDNLVYVAWLMDTYSVYSAYSNDVYAQMAALQLAIWEVILDYDPEIEIFDASLGDFIYDMDDTTGTVSTTGSVDYYFAEYLTSLANSTDENLSWSDLSDTYAVGVLTDASGPVQTVLIKSPIPEPGTAFLFCLGLLGLGAMGRRKL